ncbi:MAG: 5'/3'-nucleotidase SurE [Alphaproteobacteria bacterium]
MTIDLKNTRILVTNDDGVEAEGIEVLSRIARALSDDVWIVAPAVEQSGAAHSLTMHEPLRYRKVAERRYAVMGTPTDAVLMGLMEILTDKKTGAGALRVNRGSNLAEDVTYSGTVAAAMEGTLLEIPSVALSNYIDGAYDRPVDWSAVEEFAPRIIRALAGCDWPHGTLMNVNFPGLPAAQVKGVTACPQGRRKIEKEKLHKRTDPRGRTYFWIGGPGTTPFEDQPTADYRKLAEGYITVTPVQLDLTNYAMLADLEKLLA